MQYLAYAFAARYGRLLALASGLLTACSSAPSTSVASQDSPHLAGARADSLNGLPGHHFGDPLSSFPGLEAWGEPLGPYRRYHYGTAHPDKTSWFGKHAEDLSGVTYLFLEDKFAGFRATQLSPAQDLRQEALYLLGPGEAFGRQLSWSSELVQASFKPRLLLETTPAMELEILSKPLLVRAQQLEQQQLRAENAPDE